MNNKLLENSNKDFFYKEGIQVVNSEILKNITGFEWYESHLPKWVRLFRNEDYTEVDLWMKDLANFYDGHTEDNKLIDQLVWTHKSDENWFFTKNKIMLMLEENSESLWMVCLNIKRWWSVKIWPVVIAQNARWKWLWKLLFSAVDQIAKDFNIRKLYAKTSHLNERVNKIFEKSGYNIEAIFPDQYKKWSNEYIWWKMDSIPSVDWVENIEWSVNDSIKVNGEIYIQDHLEEQDIDYLREELAIYRQWHDDLWDDFLEMLLKWFERWKLKLHYQDKGKKILIAKDSENNYVWTLTFSPKRWWPVKIYPMSWTTEAQRKMIEKALKIAKDNSCHKLYTFAHELDTNQITCLKEIWFESRWKLVSPYKAWHNLIPFDLFVK